MELLLFPPPPEFMSDWFGEEGDANKDSFLFLLQKINPPCVPLCVLDVFVLIGSCLSSQAGRIHLVTHVNWSKHLLLTPAHTRDCGPFGTTRGPSRRKQGNSANVFLWDNSQWDLFRWLHANCCGLIKQIVYLRSRNAVRLGVVCSLFWLWFTTLI